MSRRQTQKQVIKHRKSTKKNIKRGGNAKKKKPAKKSLVQQAKDWGKKTLKKASEHKGKIATSVALIALAGLIYKAHLDGKKLPLKEFKKWHNDHKPEVVEDVKVEDVKVENSMMRETLNMLNGLLEKAGVYNLKNKASENPKAVGGSALVAIIGFLCRNEIKNLLKRYTETSNVSTNEEAVERSATAHRAAQEAEEGEENSEVLYRRKGRSKKNTKANPLGTIFGLFSSDLDSFNKSLNNITPHEYNGEVPNVLKNGYFNKLQNIFGDTVYIDKNDRFKNPKGNTFI